MATCANTESVCLESCSPLVTVSRLWYLGRLGSDSNRARGAPFEVGPILATGIGYRWQLCTMKIPLSSVLCLSQFSFTLLVCSRVYDCGSASCYGRVSPGTGQKKGEDIYMILLYIRATCR